MINNIIKVATLELKKTGKVYDKRSLSVVIIAISFAIFSSLITVYMGINADSRIYTSASDVIDIEDHRFVHTITSFKTALPHLKDGNLDLFVTRGYIVISGSDKSISACDEMIKILKKEFERELFLKYGIPAFPVLIDVKYLKREATTTFIEEMIKKREKMKEEIKEREKEKEKKEEEGGEEKEKEEIKEEIEEKKEKIVEKIITETETNIPKLKSEEYTIPSKFSPPKLISKIFYGFAFILPLFFVIQTFSSSLIKDKVARRFDVLLSAPIKRYEIVVGMLIPYLTIATALICIESILFSVNAIPFIVPPTLFLFFLQSYITLTARSYKEATFLLVMFNIFVTAYLFLPAIFSGTPISKVSPVTLLLAEMSGEEVTVEELLFSTSQFILMSASLFFLTVKVLDIEILYTGSIVDKTICILSRSLKSFKSIFLASAMTVPFVFIAEFFLIFLFFTLPLETSLPVFLLLIAIVEELAKCFLILSMEYRGAIATALGFFTAEKLTMLVSIMKSYQYLFLAQYFLFPLILHLATCLTFAKVRGLKGYISATSLHFTYNYLAVVMLS
jgi:ABC-type Na+ efflux pump permease subunit